MIFNKKVISASVGLALAGALVAAPASAVEFGVFGDVSYSGSDAPGAVSSFALGGLDFFARQQIDPKTIGFIEYVFENNGEGFVLDLERLYVQRTINDGFKVSMGRFHSPLGYWNNNYHHGVLIQETVSRPSFLDFEDGAAAILPTHVVGATVSGEVAGLGYEVAVANSTFLDSVVGGEIGIANVADANLTDSKTVFARATYDVKSLGLQLGGSYMSNSIVESNVAGAVAQGEELIKQTVIGVDGRYSIAGLDILGEYFGMTNKEAAGVDDGKSHSATAMYLQAGYQVTEKLRPVYRYESLAFDAQAGDLDEYFKILDRDEYTANVIAVRYDLDESNALTFEYKMTNFADSGQKDYNAYTVDWSFLMF